MRAAEKLINKLMFHVDRIMYPPNQRSSNPFGTHLPVLASMAILIRPKTILELGSGRYSYRIFLNKDFFPLVEKVDSFENDRSWSDIVKSLVGNDERFELICQPGAISMQIENIDLEKYDLIFIDDSVTSEERCDTIRTIASKRPKRPIAVIHDFDHFPYRKASSRFEYSFRFDSMNPHTGVVWNANQLEKKKLNAVNGEIKHHYAVGQSDGEAELFNELKKFIDLINKKAGAVQSKCCYFSCPLGFSGVQHKQWGH